MAKGVLLASTVAAAVVGFGAGFVVGRKSVLDKLEDDMFEDAVADLFEGFEAPDETTKEDTAAEESTAEEETTETKTEEKTEEETE